MDLVNLDVGGSAWLEPFTARTMRDTPAPAISIKMGFNGVNLDLMRLHAFGPVVQGILDIILDGPPATPLLVIPPFHCGIHEQPSDPGAFTLAALADNTLRFTTT